MCAICTIWSNHVTWWCTGTILLSLVSLVNVHSRPDRMPWNKAIFRNTWFFQNFSFIRQTSLWHNSSNFRIVQNLVFSLLSIPAVVLYILWGGGRFANDIFSDKLQHNAELHWKELERQHLNTKIFLSLHHRTFYDKVWRLRIHPVSWWSDTFPFSRGWRHQRISFFRRFSVYDVIIVKTQAFHHFKVVGIILDAFKSPILYIVLYSSKSMSESWTSLDTNYFETVPQERWPWRSCDMAGNYAFLRYWGELGVVAIMTPSTSLSKYH